MAARAGQTDVIDVKAEHIPELATMALARLGWRVEIVNENLREIAASFRTTERISGNVWNYNYRAIIRWGYVADNMAVTVDVEETENAWTQRQCDEFCSRILGIMAENAWIMHEVEKQGNAPNTYGSARWATDQDLVEAGYKTGVEDPTRLILGPADQDSFLTIPTAQTNQHALVCGPTGCGKTSSVFIPNLIDRLWASAIVTEATAGNEPPDLYHKTAGYRFMAGGHNIYYFNPDDLCSDRINPLAQVNSVDSAQNISNIIIQNTSKKYSGGDPIWETSERHLLTALSLHFAADGGHLGQVRKLLREGPEGMGKVLEKSTVEEARAEYWAFYKNTTEGFRNGVTSGLMQRLNLWINPRIVALTETTDIDIEALSQQLFTFYLAVPAQKTHLKPLAALVFNYILDLALQKQFDRPLFLSLDEFTNFGYIPAIAEKLTIIRHRGIPAMVGIQDYVQMQKVYGKEDAQLLFGQPGTKVFFRPRDVFTARKISESLGMQTVVERKVTSSGQIHQREFGRPLMNQGEVMALDSNKSIVFTPSTPPILLDRFTWQEYASATDFKPPPRAAIEVDETLKKLADAASSPEGNRKRDKRKRSGRKGRNKKSREDMKREQSYTPPPQ